MFSFIYTLLQLPGASTVHVFVFVFNKIIAKLLKSQSLLECMYLPIRNPSEKAEIM